MKIALDFDKTYDRDIEFWSEFGEQAMARGYDVRIVTARNKELDNIDHMVHPRFRIIYCNGVAKRFWCREIEQWEPDIWIDDKPSGVDQNHVFSPEDAAEWRRNRPY